MDQDYPTGSLHHSGRSLNEKRSSLLLNKSNRRLLLQAVLLLLTVFFTIKAGFLWNVQFLELSQEEVLGYLTEFPSQLSDLMMGLPFALTILVILLAHEMGHYFACRFYRIKATLPYVIPAPPWHVFMGQFVPLVLFGTFGAIIRIRSLFSDRKQLFDVGIAGPLAGFLFILPALAVGLYCSTQIDMAPTESTLEFGEPLLFQFASHVFYQGSEGSAINLHPIGWAAWFGMLATSFNLLPVGQLDGGHVVYALFGKRVHQIVSYTNFGGLIVLGLLFWPGYLVFALVLVFLKFRHPRPFFDQPVIGRGRVLVALLGLAIMVLTFMPVPVRIIEQ